MQEESSAPISGLLLVDKPKDWTSHDVVAKLRGALKRETGLKKPKVGHTGTLDSLATGLMVVVIGKYTKRAGEFSKLDKTYEVNMRLGQTSTTGDEEGEKTAINDHQPTDEEINTVLQEFVGQIEQTPPAYSAVKIDGKRAYQLAREGKKPEIKPRQVTIFDISDISYKYPNISFVVRVSSGTYIRSLVEDVGEKLGTGAYMTDLRRTTVGNFDISSASGLQDTDILQKVRQI